MLRDGIINARLAAALAGLRHTDAFVVADSGLPLPAGDCDLIDLAVVYGLPRFMPVLQAVLAAVVVEEAVLAREMQSSNPGCHRSVTEVLRCPVAEVGHEELKSLVGDARFVVRTGEATPYANVVLRCGVPF